MLFIDGRCLCGCVVCCFVCGVMEFVVWMKVIECDLCVFVV